MIVVKRYLQCDGCSRFSGDAAGVGEAEGSAVLRRVAKREGWAVDVKRVVSGVAAKVRADFCGSCRALRETETVPDIEVVAVDGGSGETVIPA